MPLITDAYRDLQRQMFREHPTYGTSGAVNADLVRKVTHWGRKRLLDYGAGRQTLAEALGPAYRVTNYDPCIEGLDEPPDPHPVVVCGDVMEHVEPECVDAVLRDIRRVTQQTVLFMIHLGPAEKTLPDGRNCHLVQQPAEWWRARIEAAGFHITEQGDGFTPDGKVVGWWGEALPC